MRQLEKLEDVLEEEEHEEMMASSQVPLLIPDEIHLTRGDALPPGNHAPGSAPVSSAHISPPLLRGTTSAQTSPSLTSPETNRDTEENTSARTSSASRVDVSEANSRVSEGHSRVSDGYSRLSDGLSGSGSAGLLSSIGLNTSASNPKMSPDYVGDDINKDHNTGVIQNHTGEVHICYETMRSESDEKNLSSDKQRQELIVLHEEVESDADDVGKCKYADRVSVGSEKIHQGVGTRIKSLNEAPSYEKDRNVKEGTLSLSSGMTFRNYSESYGNRKSPCLQTSISESLTTGLSMSCKARNSLSNSAAGGGKSGSYGSGNYSPNLNYNNRAMSSSSFTNGVKQSVRGHSPNSLKNSLNSSGLKGLKNLHGKNSTTNTGNYAASTKTTHVTMFCSIFLIVAVMMVFACGVGVLVYKVQIVEGGLANIKREQAYYLRSKSGDFRNVANGLSTLETKTDLLKDKTDKLIDKTIVVTDEAIGLERKTKALYSTAESLESRIDSLETKTDSLGTKTNEVEAGQKTLEGKVDTILAEQRTQFDDQQHAQEELAGKVQSKLDEEKALHEEFQAKLAEQVLSKDGNETNSVARDFLQVLQVPTQHQIQETVNQSIEKHLEDAVEKHISGEITPLKIELGVVHNDVSKLNDVISDVEKHVEKVDQRVDGVDKRVKSQISDFDTQVADALAKLKYLPGDHTTLTSTVRRITALEREIFGGSNHPSRVEWNPRATTTQSDPRATTTDSDSLIYSFGDKQAGATGSTPEVGQHSSNSSNNGLEDSTDSLASKHIRLEDSTNSLGSVDSLDSANQIKSADVPNSYDNSLSRSSIFTPRLQLGPSWHSIPKQQDLENLVKNQNGVKGAYSSAGNTNDPCKNCRQGIDLMDRSDTFDSSAPSSASALSDLELSKLVLSSSTSKLPGLDEFRKSERENQKSSSGKDESSP